MTDDGDESREVEVVDSSLRLLARRQPQDAGWLPADTVRRTVRLRRSRRILGAGMVVLLAAASTFALTRSSSHHGSTTPDVALSHGQRVGQRLDGAVQLVARTTPLAPAVPGTEDAVAAADVALAVKLLQQLDSNGAKNISVSPSSLYLALAMAQNGARGATRSEIAAALQASGIDTVRQNAGLSALTKDWAAAAKSDGFRLESANSLWQQRGFPLTDRFLTDMAAYFQTGVWQADFLHDNANALEAINAWTAQHTDGKIAKLFDGLDPNTVLVLANAIYFQARWATPFDPNLSHAGEFTRADGATVAARFMNGAAPVLNTADYDAAQLSYAGGRFAAVALMPTRGSLREFVNGLTADELARIAAGLDKAGRGPVELPRFTTATMTNMRRVLQALGMRQAFTDGADFSALSPMPVMIDQVIQRVYVSVGEKGTTAAAATGVTFIPTSGVAGPSAVFDHPFLFLIRDTKTGAIVFASEIQDPAAG